MTTPSPEQKLIEALEQIASGTEDELPPYRALGSENMKRIAEKAIPHAEALLSELAELREKAEALEWLILNERDAIETLMISSLNDWPAILKVMLSERK